MARSAHIVAVGARCAVGFSAEAAAAAIRAGVSRLAEHPVLTTQRGDGLVCARDPQIAPDLGATERMTLLAEHALRQVAAKLGADGPGAGISARALLALPEARPGFAADRAPAVVGALRDRAIPGIRAIELHAAGRGHAGALAALAAAVERVASGGDELCIAGGVDSYLDPATIGWLDAERRIKREGVRDGFPPGEGAAWLAVASDLERRRLRLPSLARVRAAACADERRDPAGPGGLLGEALSQAVDRATGDLRAPSEVVSDVYCDINGERPRTEEWGFTLMRAGERFRDGAQYVTPVGASGDLGAAGGALGCGLAVQAWRRGYSVGPLAMVWGQSWGGLRAAVLLERGNA